VQRASVAALGQGTLRPRRFHVCAVRAFSQFRRRGGKARRPVKS
jgi:hypothetical protein